MDRLAMLEKLASAQPDDPFPLYGLAMEHKRLGHPAEARSVFERLTERHPDYVASYLMFGNLLVELDDREAAVSVYDRGIEVARAQGEDHALSELLAARAELA